METHMSFEAQIIEPFRMMIVEPVDNTVKKACLK